MLKAFSKQSKGFQRIVTALVALIVAVVGTYFLSGSHAATPYVSLEANTGHATNGAASETCTNSLAANGQCVVFGAGGGSNMIVGMNAGGWGSSGDSDVTSAVKYVRIDQSNCNDSTSASTCSAGADVINLANDGAKVDLDFSGPYQNPNYGGHGGGVSAIVANGGDTSWANNALAWYRQYCGTTSTKCPMIEVLNEPDGAWFWGINSSDPTTKDQANATAYATLVKTTYNTFHAAFGNNSPLILTAWDGNTWGGEWWNAIPNMGSFVDGVIVHPYGGTTMDSSNPPSSVTASFAASAAGNQQQVIDAHSNTSKPVYLTEVGWPTNDAGPSATTTNETGDSFQWPEADSASNTYHGLDQCDNVYNFINWARSTGYVDSVMIYGYLDNISGNPESYGLETWNNGTTRYKDGWFGLKAAALNQSNPCPSAANHYTQPS